ncbi:MAG: response regulator transcription factor [Dysgonamonadaceae bacterium]|jgi:DNA-binding NarL/FixJ family response regulator|nr:response regulator transcription factor [Dysgonamonadaceae bacterium]
MKTRIHIVIAEPSVIIRSGLVAVLKRLFPLNIDIAEISDMASLPPQLCKYNPDILIVDSSRLGLFSLGQIKTEVQCPQMKTIALQSTLTDKTTLLNYDDVISIYDSAETIKEKLTALTKKEENNDNKQELSQREKEIVVCIVKGMTNKQIAEKLFLSTHTIITHRRNITNKLQIHSPAGLTIYAIVKKLVEINDIKSTIIPEE